jgi:hypothetical protein
MCSTVSSFADVLSSISVHLKNIDKLSAEDGSILDSLPQSSADSVNDLFNLSSTTAPNEEEQQKASLSSLINSGDNDTFIINNSLKNYALKLYDMLTDDSKDATDRDLLIIRRACQECAKHVHKKHRLQIEDEDGYMSQMQQIITEFIEKENKVALQHDKINEESLRALEESRKK